MKNRDKFYDLDLGEHKKLYESAHIIRVPGGWVMRSKKLGRNRREVLASSFIPYSGEFCQEKTEPGKATGNTKDSDHSKEQKQRRNKILQLAEEKGEITVNDVSEIIEEYTQRTLQRDLKSLVESDDLKSHGKRRWTYYTLNNKN